MNTPSARILLCTFGSLGDVHPYVALGLELKRRGHEAIVATHAPYRSKVEGVGLGFRSVRPDGAEGEDRVELMSRVMDRRRGPEVVIKELFMGAIRESYEDTLRAAEGVDLIVTHPLTYAAIPAAEVLGIRWASSVLAPMSFLSAHDPPALPLFPAFSRLGGLGPGVFRPLIRLAKRRVDGWMEPYHRLRSELGLPPVAMPMFEGGNSPDLVLALFSKVLGEPQPDWPSRTCVTGFCHYDEDEAVDEDLERLDAFLDAGDAPVVFTLGSSAVWKASDFYVQALDAIRRLGRRAVLLIGRDGRNVLPEPLPPGVAVFHYAPYSRVFPRCAAIVHQGGVGTTAQAMRAGRPMLVVPFAFDQFDNARCVERLGVARSISRSRFDAGRAAAMLRGLLDMPSYASNAARVGEAVRAEDGPAAAADALLGMLRTAARA